jgi:PAS domain S-box-containing protein
METSAPGWLLRRIVEEIPEAMIFADRQGAVRLWNRGAETMFGYSAAEALGQRPGSDHPGALSRPTLGRLPTGHGHRDDPVRTAVAGGPPRCGRTVSASPSSSRSRS